MSPKSPSALLERFQFKAHNHDTDILITCCPKTAFKVHPDVHRVVENVLVVYRDNRWHLVDCDLYRNGVYIHGLLRADIYDCMDSNGTRFLLISTYPLSGEMTTWRDSVLDVVDMAIDEWVKMKRVETGYETQLVDGIRYIPRWPKQAMEDFVLEAFGENIILADG